ncbi:MAG: ATP F0F1 synthase subunit B' [Hyphomicrobiales bacterium]|nr:MAG: ATP F0F1 synthase subunit B' [Hyphomicrobiales bacterium]
MASPAAEHGAEAASSFPPFDPSTFGSQLLWLAITFGVLYWLMSKVALPRLSDILEVRRDRIMSDLDEAQRLKDESEEAIASYEQSLAEARKKAHDIALSAREKALAEVDAAQAKTDKSLQAKMAEAEAAIAETRNSAMAEVAGIAAETASELVSVLIGSKPTKAALTKAVKAADSAA